MRTQEEIAAKVTAIQAEGGFLDFRPEVLLAYLDFEHAQPFLKPDATEETWEARSTGRGGYNPNERTGTLDPADEETLKADMLIYLAFAWEKAEDRRGISASRSVQKLEMWLWLLGSEKLAALAADDDSYAPYGAPILAAISKEFGVPIPAGMEKMAAGSYEDEDTD